MIQNGVWKTYIEAGTNAYKQGEYQAAGRLFHAAVKESKQWQDDDPRLPIILNNMAGFYFQQKRYKKAELFYKRALLCYEKSKCTNKEVRASIFNQLADLYYEQNQLAPAMRYYKKAFYTYTQACPNMPEPALTAFQRVFDIYCQQKKLARAETWCNVPKTPEKIALPLLNRVAISYAKLAGLHKMENNDRKANSLEEYAFRLQQNYLLAKSAQ